MQEIELISELYQNQTHVGLSICQGDAFNSWHRKLRLCLVITYLPPSTPRCQDSHMQSGKG